MAIDLTLKSTAIANREATPSVANNPGAGGASRLHSVYGFLASVPAGLSATSIIRLCDVPSNAIVTSLKFYTAIQAAGDGHVGVYRNNKDGGAVVDADYFASSLSLIAAVDGSEISNESATNTIAKRNDPLWKALGMAEDPKSSLDICFTVTVDVTTGLGALGVRCEYAQ
jgi:hypothetical protein